MKKIFSTIGLIVLGLSLTQCQDDLKKEFASNSSKNQSAELFVEKPQFGNKDSRTVTDENGKVEWSQNDQLLCYVIESDKEFPYGWGPSEKFAYRFNADSKDYKAGHFVIDDTFNFNYHSWEDNTLYNWYMLYPFTKHQDVAGISYIHWNVYSIQEQDYEHPTAHIGALDLVTGEVLNVLGKDKPTINAVHHKTLLKFKVTNKTGKSITLKSLKMTTEGIRLTEKKPQEGLGSFSFDIKNSRILYPNGNNYDFNDYATVSLTNAKPLAANASYDFYMIVPQFTLNQGKKMTIDVSSDLGVSSQAKNMTRDINFKAGTLNSATIDISDFKKEEYLSGIDENFMTYLLDAAGGNTDQNGDGKISLSEAQKVKSINIYDMDKRNITSVKGIEYFTELTSLTLSGTSYNEKGKLQTLDVSKNTKLEYLDCKNNEITDLFLGELPNLSSLYCSNNSISTPISLKSSPKIISFEAQNNKIPSIEVSKADMYQFICSNNPLTGGLKLEGRISMLECNNCQLSSLDLSKVIGLSNLKCSNNNLPTIIFAGQAASIIYLTCDHNKLTTLDLSKSNIYEIYCSHNNLSTLDLSNSFNIRTLYIDNNPNLTKVKVADGFKEENLINLKKDSQTSFEIVPDQSKLLTFANKGLEQMICSEKNNIDLNKDGHISEKEAEKAESILLEGNNLKTLTALENMDKFPHRRGFCINDPYSPEITKCPIKNLDLSTHTGMEMVAVIGATELETFNVGKQNLYTFALWAYNPKMGGGAPKDFNTKLKVLDLSKCQLNGMIMIVGFTGLTDIYVAPGTEKERINGDFDRSIIKEKK